METQNVTTALPKLPGFSFPDLHERSTFRKAQTLVYRGGLASFVPLDTLGVRPEKAKITRESILTAKPEWSQADDKVLRFFGYFVEVVGDENWTRRVNLMYFLKDGTVLITEPNNVNMRFLKRQVVDGVNPETLTVGTMLTINGRKFTLTSCDEFTRGVFEALGYPQPPAIATPANKFDEKEVKSAKRAVPGPSKKLASAVNRSLIENDKKVLRFPAHWTDRAGDVRNFNVLYYIADATICVQEVLPPNSGRDPASNFYKRSRLPKGCETSAVTKGLDTIAPKTVQQFYTHEDLTVGCVLSVYGRSFTLYDADQYTRDFYKNELGCELGPALSVPETQTTRLQPQKEVELPAHTGIGSDEDSMGSLRYLVLKPPKKDLKKMMDHGKDVLRFRATLHNARPEDNVRNFVICFYVGDDTVSVFEQSGLNTGYSAGRFLVRQRVRTSGPTEPAKYLLADDFQAGSTVKIYSHVFALHQMDERTAKFLDGVSLETTAVDVTELVGKLRAIVSMKYSRYTDAFRSYNVSKGRGLSVEELRRMFVDNSITVDQDALLVVMKYLDADGDGYIGFGEFVQYMTTSDDQTQKPQQSSNAESIPSYRKAVHDVQQRQFAANTFKMFRDKLQSRRLVLVDAFRIMSDCSPDSKVGWAEFRSVVNDYLQMNFSPEQLDALCAKFFVSAFDPTVVDDKRRLSLREFNRLLDQDIMPL
jgi:Ca2+-binding EF-hand superfamily protein